MAQRSQLVAGLRSGPGKKEVQRLIRRASRLTFKEACKNLKELEQEVSEGDEGENVEAETVPGPALGPLLELERVRQALREEMCGV